MEEENLTSSPVLPKARETLALDFYDALREVMNGKRITRIEWKNPQIYGFLAGGHLSLHMNDKVFDWIVSDGDMDATDWVIVSEAN